MYCIMYVIQVGLECRLDVSSFKLNSRFLSTYSSFFVVLGMPGAQNRLPGVSNLNNDCYY